MKNILRDKLIKGEPDKVKSSCKEGTKAYELELLYKKYSYWKNQAIALSEVMKG